MNVLVVGCGHIGHSLVEVFSKAPSIKNITVIQPSLKSQQSFQACSHITFYSDISLVPTKEYDTIIFTVKPVVMPTIINSYRKLITSDTYVVSVLASLPVEYYLSKLGEETKLIRLMPNVGIIAESSMNVCFGASNLKEEDINYINKLFSCTGEMFWVENEKTLNYFTVITGSGPAFFYLLADSLYNQCLQLGISQRDAEIIIKQLLNGTSEYAKYKTETNFKQLMDSVATKKGITATALESLDSPIRESVAEAVDAGYNRILEVANDNCY